MVGELTPEEMFEAEAIVNAAAMYALGVDFAGIAGVLRQTRPECDEAWVRQALMEFYEDERDEIALACGRDCVAN